MMMIQRFLICVLLLGQGACSALSLSPIPLPKKQVIVTGAAGRTGQLIFSALMQDSRYYALGLVRTESSAKKLIKEVQCGLENIWVCDVTQLNEQNNDGLPKGINEAEAMIICTSAVPVMRKRSLAKAFLKIPFNVLRGQKAFDFRSLEFYYKPGQHPEIVDYEGQLKQIDLAKQLGVSHIVLVSSMGATDPDDFLNALGKNKNGEGHGDILIWKRKAEKYLVDSGLQYTIIHPGGLKNSPGGEMNLHLDVDDKLKANKIRTISRCDVARLGVAALSQSNGKSTSFDCVNAEIPEGSRRESADTSLREFMASEMMYDYSDMDEIVEDYSI